MRTYCHERILQHQYDIKDVSCQLCGSDESLQIFRYQPLGDCITKSFIEYLQSIESYLTGKYNWRPPYISQITSMYFQ